MTAGAMTRRGHCNVDHGGRRSADRGGGQPTRENQRRPAMAAGIAPWSVFQIAEPLDLISRSKRHRQRTTLSMKAMRDCPSRPGTNRAQTRSSPLKSYCADKCSGPLGCTRNHPAAPLGHPPIGGPAAPAGGPFGTADAAPAHNVVISAPAAKTRPNRFFMIPPPRASALTDENRSERLTHSATALGSKQRP